MRSTPCFSLGCTSYDGSSNSRRSVIEELCEMVMRKAPLYMRAGGGCLQESRPPFITPNERERIDELLAAGRSLEEIAAETGRHYSTIAKITRHQRSGKKAGG